MMQLQPQDIIPISQARAKLTQLADEVATQGRHKVLTRNGESYVAIVTADELEELEQYRAQQRVADMQAFIAAAQDIEAGRVHSGEQFKPVMANWRQRARQLLPDSPAIQPGKR
jgi:prevent-host-death family protein